MLRPGEKIDTGCFRMLDIPCTVHASMNQSRRQSPIFGRGVRVEHFWYGLRVQSLQQTVFQTGDRINLRYIGKRKLVPRIKIAPVDSTGWLGETMVKASASIRPCVCDQAVKDLSVSLVLIETVPQKSAQITATLRIPECYGPVDAARRNRKRIS